MRVAALALAPGASAADVRAAEPARKLALVGVTAC